MNPLKEWFDAHTSGAGIWKWGHYFDIYHHWFEKFRFRPVHVCEVGIYSGGSLEMWQDYFGAQAQIYGVDIQPACKKFERPGVQIFTGDQSDRDFWKKFKQEVPHLDILIDDGGHEAHQQIATFEEMFAHLAPGGVYLCEDIHGIDHGFTKYVAGTAACMNVIVPNPATTVTTFGASNFQRYCAGVHVYPYVMVAERTVEPVDWFTAPAHGSEWIHTTPEWKP